MIRSIGGAGTVLDLIGRGADGGIGRGAIFESVGQIGIERVNASLGGSAGVGAGSGIGHINAPKVGVFRIEVHGYAARTKKIIQGAVHTNLHRGAGTLTGYDNGIVGVQTQAEGLESGVLGAEFGGGASVIES